MSTSIAHLIPPLHYAAPSDTTELRIDLVGRPRPAVIPCGPCTAYGIEGCNVHTATADIWLPLLTPTAELLLPLRPQVTRVERKPGLAARWKAHRQARRAGSFTADLRHGWGRTLAVLGGFGTGYVLLVAGQATAGIVA